MASSSVYSRSRASHTMRSGVECDTMHDFPFVYRRACRFDELFIYFFCSSGGKFFFIFLGCLGMVPK